MNLTYTPEQRLLAIYRRPTSLGPCLRTLSIVYHSDNVDTAIGLEAEGLYSDTEITRQDLGFWLQTSHALACVNNSMVDNTQ